ncbi:hypothetical protein XaC1_442 [Xanthomonas phage XaC1]|nr:hypothetical protein XaC1_442 [Xanthomonas phage XaC1]
MEKIYNTAHTRICTYDDALKLLESLSLQTELSILAMSHNESGKVSITYSFNKDVKEQLSLEVIASYIVKAKSDIYSYIMEDKKRNLDESEKVKEFVAEPVLPKVASFFENLLTKFEEVAQEDNPEVLNQITAKLQEAADDVSKMDLFDYERPAALMKQVLNGYKNALNIPVNEVLFHKDKTGNLKLNEGKEPQPTEQNLVEPSITVIDDTEQRKNAKIMRDILHAVEEADNGTYHKKIADEIDSKVLAYNATIDSVLPLQKEIYDLVQKLPNKESYDVFINESGKFEVVKVPGVSVLKNVKFGSQRSTSEYDVLYVDMYHNGVFSSENAIPVGANAKHIMYSTTKVPFERFTITRSGNNFIAVEVVEDLVDEITRLAGVKK